MRVTTTVLMLTSIATTTFAHIYPRGAHAAPIAATTWTVQPHPNSAPISLYGTYTEILTQLSVLNPTWESDFAASHTSPFVTSKASEKEKRDRKNEIREAATMVGWAAPKCSSSYGNVSNLFVKNGIKHLNGVKGEPRMKAGPGSCERVSCETDSAIWWCNDYDFDISLVDYKQIANGAQAIMDGCKGQLGNLYTGGEVKVKDPYNWRVLVRSDKFCKSTMP